MLIQLLRYIELDSFFAPLFFFIFSILVNLVNDDHDVMMFKENDIIFTDCSKAYGVGGQIFYYEQISGYENSSFQASHNFDVAPRCTYSSYNKVSYTLLQIQQT